MKIGIYGGTFDPIHHGHLLLARDAMEFLKLDKIVFFPARLSPHKEGTPPTPAEVRLEMVEAAVKEEPGFEVNNFEIHRESPSYTVDTLQMMREQHPGSALFLLMGSDNLPKLDTWKDIALLKKMAQIVVLGRNEGEMADFPVISRRIDISSTEIRMRVAKGLSIRYLVPEQACRVLEKQKLYQQ